jgi:hypothetical protein
MLGRKRAALTSSRGFRAKARHGVAGPIRQRGEAGAWPILVELQPVPVSQANTACIAQDDALAQHFGERRNGIQRGLALRKQFSFAPQASNMPLTRSFASGTAQGQSFESSMDGESKT